jgi:acyl-[acyl-carrier-protein]-phospholipid O-acyltransferase/long-chain-fatty-acid--[acyl-carrier-protein] ligase
MSSLLLDRRFGPLFATSLLGAVNDNILRTAVIVHAAMTIPAEQAATVGLMAAGIFTLPFVLLSAVSGSLADRHDKAAVVRVVKMLEVVIVLGAGLAFASRSIAAMLGVLLAMGVHSTLYGPIKQGWLPERLQPEELVRANAWMESGTFLAILAGTILGGLTAGSLGLTGVSALCLAVALLGLGTAALIPRGAAAAPDLPIAWNPVTGTVAMLRDLGADRVTLKAVLLLSWFWGAGSIYLSSLPAFLRGHLGASEVVITLVMALFALGVGGGSVLVNRLLKGHVGLWPVALASAVMAGGALLLWAGLVWLPKGSGLSGLLGTVPGAVVVLGLLGVAAGGGVFTIPLAATVQHRAAPQARARTMAAMAVATSLGIAASSLLTSAAVAVGLPIRGLFLAVALLGLGVVGLTVAFFPRESLQGLLRTFILRWFRVEVVGLENLEVEGPVVFAPNHVSLVDGPLLFSLIERDCCFAMDTSWAGNPVLSRIGRLVPLAPVNALQPMAAKGLVQRIRAGEACVIFPEGRLTTTGSLMKIYPGTAWLIDAADAPIVPVHFDGLEFSRQSRDKVNHPLRWRPRVRVSIGAPCRLAVDPALKGKARREVATEALRDLMELHRLEAMSHQQNLVEALRETADRFGREATVIEDPLGNALSLGRIELAAAALAPVLARRTERGETVGLLLPTLATIPAVMFALWREGRVPAMLNPTLGTGPALSALQTAGITRVLSSRAFVEQAKLDAIVAAFEAAGHEILWIDDLKAEIGQVAKLKALLSAKRPARGVGRDDPAVILFTSGTEGAPKGVVLSHGNLLANVSQLRTRTDVGARDRVLSAMPLFHSFGLTGGLLLPLLAGARIMTYPTPLHYKVIPELAYNHQATLIFGTDTFLQGWGRRASPADFGTLRAAIAGAEAVKQATRDLWMDRFGTRILEGYGATETAPVLALNTPISAKAGTVGRLLPGIEARLEAVPGLDGQRLLVKGPNVMLGYYRPEAPGLLQPPPEGWYDTGDAVAIDGQGFVTIKGRLKRFAKVGGEMVSLAAVEQLASATWPEAAVAAIAQPDPKKGERVILAVAGAPADRARIVARAREQGIAEILLPARVVALDRIPLLASGKTDYPALAGLLAALDMPRAA